MRTTQVFPLKPRIVPRACGAGMRLSKSGPKSKSLLLILQAFDEDVSKPRSDHTYYDYCVDRFTSRWSRSERSHCWNTPGPTPSLSPGNRLPDEMSSPFPTVRGAEIGLFAGERGCNLHSVCKPLGAFVGVRKSCLVQSDWSSRAMSLHRLLAFAYFYPEPYLLTPRSRRGSCSVFQWQHRIMTQTIGSLQSLRVLEIPEPYCK